MSTRRFSITDKCRTHPIAVVSVDDFAREPGSEIDAEEVLRDPAYTLYCFDPERDSAIFVQSSDPQAVDRAPFYYQGQCEHAVGGAEMPMDIFHELAAQIPRPPKGLILVHSVGRCGSTLLSKALQGVPSVHSLSEPDDLTQLGRLRCEGSSYEWIKMALASSIAWRCKPREGEAAEFVAIKTRSEVLVLADQMAQLFGDCRHIFLYREAVNWMRSLFRGFPPHLDPYDEENNRRMEASWARTLPKMKTAIQSEKAMNAIEIRIWGWITCMEGYLELRNTGLTTCAARFEELTEEPISILKQLFEFCRITDVDWNVMHEVLGRDSQAGTIYDREERSKLKRELTPDLVDSVFGLLATRSDIRVPDIVLPGTVASRKTCQEMHN